MGKNESETRLESQSKLQHLICSILRKHFEDSEPTSNMRLIIWLDCDEITFKEYDNSDYQGVLLQTIYNECGVIFDTVELRIGKPDAQLHCTPIGNSGRIFIQISTTQIETPNVTQTAVISIYNKQGSLMKKKYTLSSAKMRKDCISAYNIGVGCNPKIDGMYRTNHIAINDDSTSPMYEYNKYVSRAHAHIGYLDGAGFYLQVEPRGTRIAGKRTKIRRNGTTIELNNPQVITPLQNGDLIVLSNTVVLKYTTI